MVGTVSSITSAASASLIQRPDRDAQRTKMLAAVADKLGMSVDDLKSALDKGSSLNQIATSKGVAHEDLIATIKSSISGSATGAQSLLDDSRLDQVAERIASGQGAPAPKGPHGVKGAHRPPPPPPPVDDDDDDDSTTSASSALDSVAKTLKMTSRDLVDALTKGTSLESLAEQQGVSIGQVLGAVTKGMLLNVSA